MYKTIAIFLLLLLLSACNKKPDEALIRENLDQVIAAVEARQPRKVVNHLTQDFIAQERLGAKEVRQLMVAQFLRNQQINIVLTGLKVKVEGNYGSARFRAVITGGMNWLPERLDYYEVETSWLKQDGDWLIKSTHWQPVLAAA